MGTASLSMGSLISTSSCAPSGDSRDKRGKVSDDDQFLFIGDDIAIAQTEYGKVQGYLLNHVYTLIRREKIALCLPKSQSRGQM